MIYDKVNYKLLRQQKKFLIEMAEDPDTTHNHRVALEGVVNLLDDFMDDAAKDLGEYRVFGGPACEGCHSKPEHAAHVLAFQPKRLMGTEPERWLPICSDLAGRWWDGGLAKTVEEERIAAGAPERWLRPLP